MISTLRQQLMIQIFLWKKEKTFWVLSWKFDDSFFCVKHLSNAAIVGGDLEWLMVMDAHSCKVTIHRKDNFYLWANIETKNIGFRVCLRLTKKWEMCHSPVWGPISVKWQMANGLSCQENSSINLMMRTSAHISSLQSGIQDSKENL